MSVHPEVQRQGIGALLMADILDWLDRRGCAFIRLDATRAGSDLYRKMGFVTAGRTLFFSDSKLYPLPQDGWTVAPMEVTDLPGVAALDAAAFGARRDKLLRMYWDRHPGRCFIARDRNGALMGYLVAQEGRIGPLVAETRQAAEILLKTGLDLPYAERLVRLIVPEENSTGVDLFRRLGFVEGPSHLHMVKTGGARAPSGGGKPGPGMVLPGKREMIYAQASFATG
jgi:ribosomal protein S18 acetylase RimI-like enzyme